jgi:protein N-terminal amidase
LSCYVIAGYPERLVGEEAQAEEEKEFGITQGKKSLQDKVRERQRIVGANSAVIYGPEGKLLGSYRKSNLFEIDKTWAKPGSSFFYSFPYLPLS